MAITDFASLKSAVQIWCARSDATFGNQLETFIALAEERMFNGCGSGSGDPLYSPPLRSKALETTASITMTSGVGTLPATSLGLRRLFRDTDKAGLEFVPPERFSVYLARTSGAGSPIYYTVEASSVKVAPLFSGTLDALHYARPAGISSDNTSNAVLTAHPMLYLTACLFEAYSFMQEVQLALAELARYRSLVAGVNATAARLRASGAGMRVTPRAPLP